MLHGPNKCTHNNIDVHRHERDTPTGQPPHTQHRRKHHVLGHGGGTRQRELRSECDRQHAATESPCPLRPPQFQTRCRTRALHLIIMNKKNNVVHDGSNEFGRNKVVELAFDLCG